MSQSSYGKRLIVLGGGLSGLSYVHYLRNFLAYYKKTSVISKVTLIEANEYMGGSVKSNVFEDNVVHELGPRSVRLSGAKAHNTCALIEQLGLADQLLYVSPKSSAGKTRYVYRENKLFKVPSSMTQLFSKMPATNTRLIQLIKNDVMKKKRFDCSPYYDQDPPLYDFIAYRFGPDAAESVLDPLMRGITAGDARQTSTKAMFGDMLAKEQAFGSILGGMIRPPIVGSVHDPLFPNDILDSKLLDKLQKEKATSLNLSTGLQTLPEHLCNSLLNTNDDNVVVIYNKTKVKSINFNTKHQDQSPCSVKLETVDGDLVDVECDHIISTIPGKNLIDVLPKSMATEQKKALDFIAQIPHVPVGCVALEYRDLDKLPQVVNSFGFLTHSQSSSKVLGISFDSAMFPQIDQHAKSFRMTCMIGGHWYKEVFGTDDLEKVTDAQLEQIALEEVSKILKIYEDPYRMSTLLWKTGIAQYRPGHMGKVREMRGEIEKLKIPLTLLGQSYDGVAVNDVIWCARQAANEFAKSL